jgi:hypothetical protein
MLFISAILLIVPAVVVYFVKGTRYTWVMFGFGGIVMSQMLLLVCYFVYKIKVFYSGSSIRVKLSNSTNLYR